MNQPTIDFQFSPFSELRFSNTTPVMAIVFEDQQDLLISQSFPEFEFVRLRLDQEDDRGDEVVSLIPFTRSNQTYYGGIVYIEHSWRRIHQCDFKSISFYRQVSKQLFSAVAKMRQLRFPEISILLPGRFRPENLKNSSQKRDLFLFIRTVVEAMVYANHSPDQFKSVSPPPLSRVTFIYFGEPSQLVYGFFQKAINEGACLGSALGYSRRLIELPPNVKPPIALAAEALNLNLSHLQPNQQPGWLKLTGHRFSRQTKVQLLYGTETLRNFGLGLIAAVGQGSADQSCFLKIHYRPRGKRGKRFKKIVITGKGVTFDTGGIDLKRDDDNLKMHFDMAGAANVLGLIKLAEELNLRVEVIGLLPLVKNSIGNQAIDPHSVVTAYNGKTVELLNTDCEGRLVMADAVAYSEKHHRPDLTISTATLCGIEDITPSILKVLVAHSSLEAKVRRAEKESAEPIILWPSPEYLVQIDNELKGAVADLVNHLPFGFHSSGPMFIYNFFNSYPAKWVYVDISSVFFKDAFDHYSGPGFGLKFVWQLLKQYE